MRWFLSYFTRHRTAANLLLVLMVVLGAAATTQIRSQFFPDVVLDTVTVSVAWDGAGPEDVDRAIVAVLEPALQGVEGIESTEATSSEGSARLSLEFEPNWDMARAAEDVRTAVEGVTTLPEGSETPEVRRSAWRDRVTDVVISGPVDAEQLSRFADEFTARLFREGIT
ncbi:MAG: efflux RND transporter permease subunit, partial [Pseudomonadota bacterium]